MKGVSAKQCRDCQRKSLTKKGKPPARPANKPDNIHGTDIPKPGFNPPESDILTKPKVGELSADGKY